MSSNNWSVKWKKVHESFASLGSTVDETEMAFRDFSKSIPQNFDDSLYLGEYASELNVHVMCCAYDMKYGKSVRCTELAIQENLCNYHYSKFYDFENEEELQPNFTHYCGYCGNFFHPDYVSCICCGGRAQERILIEEYHTEIVPVNSIVTSVDITNTNECNKLNTQRIIENELRVKSLPLIGY